MVTRGVQKRGRIITKSLVVHGKTYLEAKVVHIKELSLVEYLSEMSLTLPPLGSFLVHSTVRKGGLLLGAYLDGEASQQPAGLLALKLAKGASLEYVFVEERFRGQGIGSALLKAAVSLVRQRNLGRLKARAVLQNPWGDVYAHILEKTGFQAYDTASIFRFAMDTAAQKRWEAFMQQRGSRICQALRGRGFRTVSFAEAGEDVLQGFLKDTKGRFPAHLDPLTFLNNHEHKCVHDHSFLALKGDEPAAYSIVTTVDGKTLTFQQLSAAFKYQGSGAFLLPVAALVDKLFSAGQFKQMSAMIYDSNEQMNRLVEALVKPLATSVKKQVFYTL